MARSNLEATFDSHTYIQRCSKCDCVKIQPYKLQYKQVLLKLKQFKLVKQ